MTNSVDHSKKAPKRWVWTLLILLVLASAVFLFVRFQTQANQARTLANLITQPLQRQTLFTSISGTGTVVARQSAELHWLSSGRVGTIEAALGAEVEAGEVLATLAEEELPANILQARLDLINVKQSLADLEATTDREREKLEADLSAARAAIPALQQEILVYEQRVCTEWNLKNLRQALEDAQANYKDNPDSYRQSLLTRAQQNLDYCEPETVAEKLDQLRAQLSQQQGSIAGLEASLAKIQSGPDPAERQKLELQQTLLEKTLEAQEITAPFAGTITSVFVQPGDAVSQGLPAFQLDDLSELFVSVPISEVDIMQIKVGQRAHFVFDAYYDQTFTGEVTEIERAPRSQGGVVTYLVKVRLDETQQAINGGMTAGVTIVIGEKSNVLAVPAEAVVSRDGKTYIYLQRDGRPQEVEVSLGEYSDRSVELLAGEVNEGDLVVLNPPADLMQMMTSRRGMSFGR